MNLVWTLLLLAAATVSVKSQASVSYQAIEQSVHETFASECESQFPALGLPQLVDSGLISTVLNPIITKIHNLVIYGTKDLHVNIRHENDGLYVDIAVTLQSRCTEFTNIDLHVELSICVEFTVLNGCPHYHFNHDSAVIQISVDNLIAINVIVGQALVTAVTDPVTQCVFGVLNKVEETINDAFNELTVVFYIGESSCHYTFQSVTQYPGQISYGYSLVDNDNNEYASYGYDEYATLQDGEFNLFLCTETIVTQLTTVATKGLEIQVELDIHGLGLESVLTGDVSLHLSINSPTQCAISIDGVNIILLADIEIYAGNTMEFAAQVYLDLDTKVAITDSSLSLSINAGISVDTNFEVTYANPGCGCQDIILQKLTAILNSCLGDLQVDLNLRLANLTPIPAICGNPGHGRSCVPNPGCIRCAEY